MKGHYNPALEAIYNLDRLVACPMCIWKRTLDGSVPFGVICLFVFRLNVPVNIFSVMSGRSQRFLGLTSTVGS